MRQAVQPITDDEEIEDLLCCGECGGIVFMLLLGHRAICLNPECEALLEIDEGRLLN